MNPFADQAVEHAQFTMNSLISHWTKLKLAYVDGFWLKMSRECPVLHSAAVLKIHTFCDTWYLCEERFLQYFTSKLYQETIFNGIQCDHVLLILSQTLTN